MVDKNLVITAAHVARGASTISAKTDRGIARADVLDYDLHTDTALLRLDQQLPGHNFTLSSTGPKIGEDIGVLGYPFGVPDLRLSRGAVSSGDTSVTYSGDDGFTVDHVVTTDAAINGGNSGGPVIDRSGEVVGLVTGKQNWTGDPSDPVPAEGSSFLVPSEIVSERYADWRNEDESQNKACSEDAEPPASADFDLDVIINSDAADADDISLALFLHGDSINQGHYDAAWSVFTAEEQDRLGDLEHWSAGLASTYWTDLEVDEIERDGDSATADVKLTTRQDREDSRLGQDCSVWDMKYNMDLRNGAWLIDYADPGAGPDEC